MRILVCGSRYWSDRQTIRLFLSRYSKAVIIQGECKGADLLAKQVGLELGFEIVSFPADWKTYGRAAGPIRNKQMLVEGKPDLVIAFHKDISTSKGTANMIKQAESAGIKCILITKEISSSEPILQIMSPKKQSLPLLRPKIT